MFYYLVKTIGDGSDENPIRPDLPIGISFVGITYKGFYLVGLNVDLPDTATIKKQVTMQQIENAALSRGYTLADVMSWFVGGSS
jgi:hypothetical protein